MKPYPTYRQREVLQLLMHGDWTPIFKLMAVGDKLLGNLLRQATSTELLRQAGSPLERPFHYGNR